MIRVALVGLGEVGAHHLRALRGSPRAELVAVCDLDSRLVSAAEGSGVRGFADFGEMLESAGPDAVDLCVPHSLHAPLAVRSLEAGAHLIVEKPLAPTLGECDEIIAVARRRGRQVGVSHNQLFFEPHAALGDLIAGGGLGRVRTLRARLGIGGKLGGWRADPSLAGGGLLMDAGVHRVYLLRELGGPVRAVSAVFDRPGAEDTLVVSLEFASGALGVIDASYHGPPGVFDDRVEVFGERGMAEVLGCEAFFEGYLEEGPQLRVRDGAAWRDHPARDSWDASVVRSVQSILASLERSETPRVDAVAARETVALIEAAYRSAETGRRVEVGPPDPRPPSGADAGG
ncbi:MAG: Gfo/Idh/MocA family oxidoreductase [Solirubrobacterales bacterium]